MGVGVGWGGVTGLWLLLLQAVNPAMRPKAIPIRFQPKHMAPEALPFLARAVYSLHLAEIDGQFKTEIRSGLCALRIAAGCWPVARGCPRPRAPDY